MEVRYLEALAQLVDAVVVIDRVVVDATRRTWLIGQSADGIDGLRSVDAGGGASVVLLPSVSVDGLGGRDRWIASLVDAVARAARMQTTVSVLVVRVEPAGMGHAIEAVLAELRSPDVVTRLDESTLGVVMELAPRDDPRAPLLAAGRMIERCAASHPLAIGIDVATGHYANAEALVEHAELVASLAVPGRYEVWGG
jgi:hypothetical protein